jgi:MFS family permease
LFAGGTAFVYACAAALFVLAFSQIYFIRVHQEQSQRPPVTLEFLFAGIQFIWNRKVVLGAVSLDLFAVLLGGATALLPIYAAQILHTDTWGLGFLRAAPAVGALVLAIYLSNNPLTHGSGKIMFYCVALFGVCTIIFGLSTIFWVSLLCLIILGAADMVSVVVRSSLVQLQTPDAMRGRVGAVNSIFIGASNQLGEFESGITAQWWGVEQAVVLGGIGTLLIVVIWIKLFPELYRWNK